MSSSNSRDELSLESFKVNTGTFKRTQSLQGLHIYVTGFPFKINIMLCPIKINISTIELTVHPPCYCVFELFCVKRWKKPWRRYVWNKGQLSNLRAIKSDQKINQSFRCCILWLAFEGCTFQMLAKISVFTFFARFCQILMQKRGKTRQIFLCFFPSLGQLKYRSSTLEKQ